MIMKSNLEGKPRLDRRKTILEIERDEQRHQMKQSYQSLVINHFENKTDEIFFSGLKINGKNEGYCEVLTNNYYFKGFYKNDKKEGAGVIQIKSNFLEPLGVEGLPGLSNNSVMAINQGIFNF